MGQTFVGSTNACFRVGILCAYDICIENNINYFIFQNIACILYGKSKSDGRSIRLDTKTWEKMCSDIQIKQQFHY